MICGGRGRSSERRAGGEDADARRGVEARRAKKNIATRVRGRRRAGGRERGIATHLDIVVRPLAEELNLGNLSHGERRGGSCVARSKEGDEAGGVKP